MSRPPFWRIPRNNARDDDPDAESSSALVRKFAKYPAFPSVTRCTGKDVQKYRFSIVIFSRVVYGIRLFSFFFFQRDIVVNVTYSHPPFTCVCVCSVEHPVLPRMTVYI